MQTSVLSGVVSTILARPVTAAEMVEVLAQLRFERLARLLHWRIAQMAQAEHRDHAAMLIEALSNEQAKAMLLAPALCEILRTGRGGADLLALIARAGRPERQHAVRLGCGIPLEAELPAGLAHPTAGLQQPYLPDRRQQAAAIASIDTALAHLQAVMPFGQQLFSGLVSTCVLRGERTRPLECWGASSGAAIGRVAIINCWSAGSPAVLAEILLHEATHCAIDCAELLVPLVPADELSRPVPGALIDSPWTGNPLTLHALIHASVVWAVLHQYWTACPPDGTARARLAFIERGFALAAQAPPLPAQKAGQVMRQASEAVLEKMAS